MLIYAIQSAVNIFIITLIQTNSIRFVTHSSSAQTHDYYIDSSHIDVEPQSIRIVGEVTFEIVLEDLSLPLSLQLDCSNNGNKNKTRKFFQ